MYMPGRSRATGMSLITDVCGVRTPWIIADKFTGVRPARIRAFPNLSQESAVRIVCLDLEGVLVPEIWIEFAERTGIPELRRTTRDEPNYDTLMKYRLDILAQKKLGLPDIQEVIASMGPMEGAREFLDALRDIY